MAVQSTPQSPTDWFAAPLGRYLIEREQRYVDDAVADVVGFNALQLGLPEHDFLRASRIPNKYRVAPAVRSSCAPSFGTCRLRAIA
jgi:hypothetical protein